MNDKVNKLNQIAKDKLGKIRELAGGFFKNRVADPFLDIPNKVENIKTGFFDTPNNPTTQETINSLKNFGVNALGIAGGLMPGVDDVGVGVYDAVKAKMAGKDASKAFTGQEYTTLGEATSKFAPESLQRVLTGLEVPAMMAFGGLKAKKIDSLDRINGFNALKRIANDLEVNDINYAVKQKAKDHALIRELAGDYIGKKFAKSEPIENVANELTNMLEMDTYKRLNQETKRVGEIPNLLKPQGLTPEINPLIQEAKKYKSAEEFVKSKGTPLYHGSTVENLKELKSSTVVGARGENQIPGIYLTPDYTTASYYGRKNGVQMYSPTEAFFYGKILELKDYNELKNILGIEKFTPEINSKIPEIIKSKGYDGIKLLNGGEKNEYIIFEPKKVKTEQQLTDIYNQAHKK